jgi:hypothetical protein
MEQDKSNKWFGDELLVDEQKSSLPYNRHTARREGQSDNLSYYEQHIAAEEESHCILEKDILSSI